MTKASINYLFPPEKITDLPTWRFVLHFIAPRFFRNKKIRNVAQALKLADFKIIEFTCDLDNLPYDSNNNSVDVSIEVSEGRRENNNSLEEYESDVWCIYGNMLEHGFGDLFYEAVDWPE